MRFCKTQRNSEERVRCMFEKEKGEEKKTKY
jgi:hypothetical protein